jgi:hypothetical protein
MAKHYLIFIHGIGERQPEQPLKQGNDKADKAQNESYDQLWHNLAKGYEHLVNGEFEQDFAPIYTDWHTERIHNAEATIFNKAFPELVKPNALSIMRPLRNFATFFLGDVVAYVSEDVNFIRRTVWQQMWAQLEQPLKEGATYSILAHSLGSVVAFDYLFSLFNPQQPELFVPKPDPAARPEDIHLEPVHYPDSEELGLLQNNFRHFFTFGSPVGLFMLRKGSLWMEGTPFGSAYNPIKEQGRVWLNFYDREDLIAYPLSELFQLNPENPHSYLPADIAINTGFTPYDAHVNYWQNKDMAEKIVRVIAPGD